MQNEANIISIVMTIDEVIKVKYACSLMTPVMLNCFIASKKKFRLSINPFILSNKFIIDFLLCSITRKFQVPIC